MTTNDAKKTISKITANILDTRGDMGLSQVHEWTRGYSFWVDACEILTAAEINDSMYDGRRKYTESLANAHED